MTAEHVEMAGAVVVGDQVDPRLHDGAAVPVRPHGLLHRGDDLGEGQAERVDVRPGQETKPQLPGRPVRKLRACPAQRNWPGELSGSPFHTTATTSPGSITAHPVSRSMWTRPSGRTSTPVTFLFSAVGKAIGPTLLTSREICPDLPMRGLSRSRTISPVMNRPSMCRYQHDARDGSAGGLRAGVGRPPAVLGTRPALGRQWCLLRGRRGSWTSDRALIASVITSV